MHTFNNDIITLANLYKQNGKELYLVGGCVRDMCMNTAPHDYDMCTNASPEENVNILSQAGIKINPKGIKYGTVTAIMPSDQFEITTYRSDGHYRDNRHPENVSYKTELKEDLCRRDFTINAMAIDPLTQQLIDNTDGLDDIENKIIRTVGDPTLRFEEDALRILRCIRFAIKLGFSIDTETQKAMIKHKHLLNSIAKERITNEFRKIFASNMPITDVFLENHEIIFEIIPELRTCYKFDHQNPYHKHDVYEHMLRVTDGIDTQKCNDNNLFITKMSALLHDIGKPATFTIDEKGIGHCHAHPIESYNICQSLLKNNFRLSATEESCILTLIKNHDIDAPRSRKTTKRFLNKFGDEFANMWLIFKDADIADHDFNINNKPIWAQTDEFKRLLPEILAENDCFTIKALNINGNDLMKELKLKPGKLIGQILNYLLDMVMNETIENKHDVLLQTAKEYIQSIK